jgi:hypothetical protein
VRGHLGRAASDPAWRQRRSEGAEIRILGSVHSNIRPR